jgi:hypothetical protein
VGRILRLSERFQFSRQLLVRPRTLPAAALAASLGRLISAPLPGALDFRAMMPQGEVWVRQVPGLSLWLYFTFTADEITVLDLRSIEPIRID